MRLLHDMAGYGGGECALALGTFDGVHRGHAALIHRTVQLARQEGICAAALTFDRHPMALLCPQRAPSMLTDAQEKARLMQALGLDLLIEQPFTPEYAAQTPQAFIADVLERLHPRIIVVGYNYTFGKAAAGNASLLRKLGKQLGFDVEVIAPVMHNGEMVSSTRIRALMAQGRISEAEDLAGHPLARLTQTDVPET